MIHRLHISQLRNLSQIALHTATCNVIIGDNGSGKTSLLEGIYLLSRGKSFRHHQPKRYIQHHQTATTIYARLDDDSSLAIQKQIDASTILRHNESTVYSQSALTQHLPTLLIDPSSMDVLEQGSASRRQLLDWLTFHVKPQFHPQWLAYQRLLKQRNALLKQTRQLNQIQRQELQAWDAGLSQHAALIHHYREQVFHTWQPSFHAIVAQMLPKYAGQLSLSYHPGYDTSQSLDAILQDKLSQDLQLGYTRVGSHRADIHVQWHSANAEQTDNAQSTVKEQAANVLSRGEKKLLITALKLSQLPVFTNQEDALFSASSSTSTETDNTTQPKVELDATHMDADHKYPKPIILLDDITAELDAQALHILLDSLSKLSCQVFITSLDAQVIALVQQYWQDTQVFHVKQGAISI